MSGGGPGGRFRECGEEELCALLTARGEDLAADEALQALLNPYASERCIRRLLELERPLAAGRVRAALAGHPRTPETQAMRLLGTLGTGWLLAVARRPQARPAVRRAAERRLVERLPGMSVGERRSLARVGGPTLMAALRNDSSLLVVRALLENPRLTERILLPLLASPRCSPWTLRAVAASDRWKTRGTIRRAICRNASSPSGLVLSLLPTLAKKDLQALAQDPATPAAVRRRAELLAGGLG